MSRRTVAEAIGTISIVASLVFVGLEIRQNTAVARGETLQTLAALQQDWLLLLADNPDLEEALNRWTRSRGVIGGNPAAVASPEDAWRAGRLMVAWLRQLELAYIQYEQGLAEEYVLSGYGIDAEYFKSQNFRGFWGSMREAFHPGFATYFENRAGLTSGP